MIHTFDMNLHRDETTAKKNLDEQQTNKKKCIKNKMKIINISNKV